MKRFLIYSILISAFAVSACTSSKQMVKPPVANQPTLLKARDHFLNGIYLQGEKRYNEALVEFYQALQYDSASSDIYTSIAENHMKLSHLESAEILLNKALKLQPKNAEAMRLLAECQLRLGRDDKAIEAFRRNLQLDPYDQDARQYLLLLYEKNGDYKNLAEQLEKLVELYGNEPTFQERLARTYLKLENYDKALFYLNALLQNDSTNAALYFLIGQIYEQKNESAQSTAYYKKALHYDPTFEGALDRLTRQYRMQQDWQAVIDMYQPVLEADSSNRPARILIGESFYYLKDYDRARSILQPFARDENTDMAIVELLGRIEFEAKNLPRAVTYFRRILQQDKSNKFAYLFLAFALSDMDSLETAEAVFKDGLSELPQDATLWSFYGMNQQTQEKYNQAIMAYRKTLELDSLNLTALSNLPVVYETLGRYQKSDSLYEIAIRRLPENDLLLNNYSYSLSERDLRMQDALKMATRAIEAQPDNAAYLDTIGWIYYKLGRYEEAEKYIKKSVEMRDGSAVVLEHLGDVYAALGKVQQAQKYWQQAYELDKTNKKLLKKMESEE